MLDSVFDFNFLKWLLKWLKSLLWLFLGIAPFTLLPYVLHRNAFCINEWRFVPDSEAIDAAVIEEDRYLDARRAFGYRKFLPFKDKQDFLRLNPNCCKILRGDEEREAYNFMGAFSIITGYYSTAVELKYMLQIADATGHLVETAAHTTHIVSSCGRAGLGENAIRKFQIPE